MDQTRTALTRVVHLFTHPFLLLLVPFIFIILKLLSSSSSKRQPLPPGPKAWPIVGNLLHIGKMPHISMANHAKAHGPLISLRLGTRVLIVGSSPMAATEILKTNDRFLSGRCVPKANPYRSQELDRISLVWAPHCTEGWKSLRALCRTELFSAKAIESQASMREKKVAQMVKFLESRQGKVVDIGEVVFTTVFNTLSNLLFSKDFIGLEDKGVASGLKNLIWKMMELGTTPNIADFYPILAGLDPQGLRRKSLKYIQEMFAVWGIYIKERRQKHGQDAPKNDFLDVFLANGFQDDQINWLTLELFSAGTDTTTTTIEWAVAELIKNKQVMRKVREELEREINKDYIHESNVSQLPYLNACIKETLRLHPPAPFLVPRRAIENCEVMNYTIPKDSQILVNVWATGRDPSAWEDPLLFKPERFLNSSLDLKGHDYEFLPFGSGRRICPGLPMATRQLPMILASLIHCFDWSLENNEDPAELNMTEKFGITLQKEHPLLIVPKRKL
ncbi:hypothetical protein P3X46_030610 [Hevea brasiliensis]|uniref:Cytochrome P450 n=1 Tax=Hevea brasiliensis TaxID=3981 RepID=A0ABQ9KKM1_HEVBR|nr:probable (S)-N-methylcoclaurine 3'-hydroxylase isozyme 2 [Hevea brasiliensis]KAJ9139918.1 hypothetical protein P3X46_030610 [Hevea brasiliensis]